MKTAADMVCNPLAGHIKAFVKFNHKDLEPQCFRSLKDIMASRYIATASANMVGVSLDHRLALRQQRMRKTNKCFLNICRRSTINAFIVDLLQMFSESGCAESLSEAVEEAKF